MCMFIFLPDSEDSETSRMSRLWLWLSLLYAATFLQIQGSEGVYIA